MDKTEYMILKVKKSHVLHDIADKKFLIKIVLRTNTELLSPPCLTIPAPVFQMTKFYISQQEKTNSRFPLP